MEKNPKLKLSRREALIAMGFIAAGGTAVLTGCDRVLEDEVPTNTNVTPTNKPPTNQLNTPSLPETQSPNETEVEVEETVPDIVQQMLDENVPGVEVVDGYKVNIRLNSGDEDEDGAEYLFDQAISFSEAAERIGSDERIYVVRERYSNKSLALYNPEDVTEKFGGKWIQKEDVVWDAPWPPNVPNFWSLSNAEQQVYKDRFVEGFIHLNTWDEYFHATDYEKFFMENFPSNTYWPDKDKIVTDYDNQDLYYANKKPTEEFSWHTPWGTPDLSKSPFDSCANHFMLMPNPEEGRNFYSAIMTVKVFNPADKNEEQNFGVLHYGFGGNDEEDAGQWVRGLTQFGGELILPTYSSQINQMISLNSQTFKVFVNTFNDRFDLLNEEGNSVDLYHYILDWVENGKVPEDLEKIITDGSRRSLTPFKQ